MNTSAKHAEALADHVAQMGRVKFQVMNRFLHVVRGVRLDGDDELRGAHVKQPHVEPGTTLLGPVSEEYVEIVRRLFEYWPVKLMIGDPLMFEPGEEPWWVAWVGGSNWFSGNPTKRPPANPDINDVADSAKRGYAVGTLHLAAMAYRCAELAGTGRLDPDAVSELQSGFLRIWEALYDGTVCAVRDCNTSDWTWDDADNRYSDGRKVTYKVRTANCEELNASWPHNEFLLGDGAVADYPRGTITYIAPMTPDATVEAMQLDLTDEHHSMVRVPWKSSRAVKFNTTLAGRLARHRQSPA